MITQFLEYLAGQPKMSKSEEEIARKAWEACRREIVEKINNGISKANEARLNTVISKVDLLNQEDDYYDGWEDATDRINEVLGNL